MNILIRQIIIQLFYVGLCFRSFKNQFNPEIFQRFCPSFSQYWPGIHPHMCASFSGYCSITNVVTWQIVNGIEVMCHPQIKGYVLYGNYDTHLALGWPPYVIIYSYDSNGNVIFTTEVPFPFECLIGQKYSGSYKCLYCKGVNYGQNCASSPNGLICGQYCKSCDATYSYCTSCIDGQSPQNNDDKKCTLACQPSHKTCQLINSVYSFNGCRNGYEFLNGQCVSCPTNCQTCSSGVCTACMWPYTLKHSLCFEDRNCMKYDFIYDSNGVPIDTDCEQCDVGYFKKGTRCASCQDEPGLEKCFICDNANECKACFGTHYLTVDKKCALYTGGCNPPCQTCLVTDPNYCTTCFYSKKLTARIIPGQCVCDQTSGYAELNGTCLLCNTGDCSTCTLKFQECTSCDPLRNRILIGNTCPCLQGYYDTGLEDKICKQCYFSCYNCQGPFDNNCTDCGDLNVYHKILFNGKCVCATRTIEINLHDGSTICQPCHSRCEKCQLPYDNSANQYCTMCIAGQNRVVSDDLKCICRDGYGEDGIVDICFKCHYSCLSCNGPSSTNCIECLSEANRLLTVNNECLCEMAYYDNGKNDVVCYLACHHSCKNCITSGEDSCTNCPSTREPDRIGTTFKCLCKDSHYYSDESQLECLECHFTCKTCRGAKDTNCLTCDLNYRQLIISKCDCPYGYYDVGELQCQQCNYTCKTCFGSQIDNCITCSSENNRILKANLCVCKDGHLEKQFGDQICLKCSYRCTSCSGTIDNCDNCPNFSLREIGVDNSCLCPPRYYDQSENPICVACHYSCLTCNGHQSNQCTSCNSLTRRQFNNQGQCLCDQKYYDSGLPECEACSNLCLECQTSPQNCTSCQPDKYLNVNTCLCKTKLQGLSVSTYQAQLSCSSCHYSCLTCKGSQSTQCDSCWNQDNRIQQGTTCICLTNYFDIGIAKCSQCNFRCQTCGALDTLCLSCPPLSLRILINSLCLCQSGYYDDGINILCQKCHYSCFTCTQTATKCVSCLTAAKRSFNSYFHSCVCNDNYTDAGVETCQTCHYSCLNCLGLNSDQCKTCVDQNVSFRIYNGGICQCILGYYDDGTSANCKKCSIQCATCQSQSFLCTSCSITRNLIGNQCVCDSSFYETGQEKCIKCDQNCGSCSVNSKTCTQCDTSQLRILNNLTNRCECQIGTTEINGVCQYCDTSCKTCLNSVTNCTSCGLMKYLQNNICRCIEGTYEIRIDKQCLLCSKKCKTCIDQENYCLSCSIDDFRIFITGNQCVCMDGYFENSSNQCIQCDQSCMTCIDNSKFCLSCDPAFNLELSNQNKCTCISGYYFNTFTKKCEACNITCKECQGELQCIECEPITRYNDPDNFQCPCKDGYYEANQSKCQLCDVTCKTCINQSIKCLTCESIYFRVYNNFNKCLCLDGYFDVGVEMCQKCNNLCKTCFSNSVNCQSCYETEQIRILISNKCICKTGYFDNGQLICQKCSKSCLTCQGERDFCTSCDINMNRIDQSAINKCPCQTNFFQDEDEVCQKCHIKCSGCIQKADNCISCKVSNTSNRLTIIQNCDCKDRYYDDGLQFQCQKCNYQCKTCIQSPSNCLICYSNLREGIPACNCKFGYFENEQSICEACDNQCSTCELLPSNCTSCRGNRINKLCDCQDGYFEAGQIDCTKCDFQCLTCQGNQSHCLQCRGDRITIPGCNCQDGFYDDYQSVNCLQCHQFCKTCNLDGCLTCKGNRELSDERTCNCPIDSISHQDTPWCSTCEVAVLNIRFSDDLLLIKIFFDFFLNPNLFQSQFQENICNKFLANETIKKLGNNPDCRLDEEDHKQLILKLGQNATINPGDSIIFIDYSIGHTDCQLKLSQFIFNQVKLPINLLSPIIEYEIPQYLLNPCDDNIILIKSKSLHGLRSIISITWSYILIGQNGNADLEDFVLQQTNLQLLDLIIPIQTLPKQSKVSFVVEFQNFIKQKGQQLIQIQTHSGQLPTVLWQGKKQYYTFEIIPLLFKIQKRQCSDSVEIQNDNSQYQISLVEIYRNNSNSRSSRIDDYQTVSANYFEVKIQKYTLSPNTAYTFKMDIHQSQTEFSSSQNVTIEISQGGILCQFTGTKKIQNYRKDSIINIYCKDLDDQFQWNEDPLIKLEVSCTDLTQNSLCKNLNNKIFEVNRTDSIQFIPKLTALPFSIWSWKVKAQKLKHSYEFKHTMVFLDNDFKILNIEHSKGYPIRPINNYETLLFEFNIPFDDRFYLLQYSIAIIYNFEVVKILEPQSYQYQFRLFDHYQQFNKGNQINFKFLAQFTNDIMPRQYDLQLFLNQPPICSIKVGSQSLQVLQQTKFVANCDIQEDSPFSYQSRYFMNNQDYEDFLKQLSDYSLILNSFQQFNYFEIYLPQSDGVVLVQIMDQRGSITNIQKQLNVTEFKLNCSDVTIKNLLYKQQIMLLLEIMINHYNKSECVKLSEQVLESTTKKLDSEDLSDQLLALQTIKLFKRFIIKFNNYNSTQRKLTQIDQESCFVNQTKSIFINHSKVEKYFSSDIINFVKEFAKLKQFTKKIILTRSGLEDQIKQNDIFINELLFQSKESISNQLDTFLLFIDDLFNKISQTSFNSDDDKEQIIMLSENLINLFDLIANILSTQVQINGDQFTLKGQLIKFQISKVTKNLFNKQLKIDQDLMDSLIVFVQKEQLEINFNYLNISNKHIQQLRTLFNQSKLEIDQQFYIRTKLQNHLYKKQFINQEKLQYAYLVDFTEYLYCGSKNLTGYNFQCAQYSNNGSLEFCNLVIQETNNFQSIQVSCKCSQMGVIFLTRYQNQSEITNEIQQNSTNMENTIFNLTNQPFLLFHGIYIVFSLFLYFELEKLQISKAIEIFHNIDLQKKNVIKLYNCQSNLQIFKISMKFVHEILCLFYCDDVNIRVSYRFLKLSIFFSILIPLSYLETLFMIKETVIVILIMNYLILLVLRMIFKIFEAIYRFKGKFKTFIIILYFLIHFLSYFCFIYQYKMKYESNLEINNRMLILIGSTVILSYVIFDPIFIYIRIVLYISIASIIKYQELHPIKQFIYFFIKHSKLDQIIQNQIDL